MRGIPRIWLAVESERDSTTRAEGARRQSYEQRFSRIPSVVLEMFSVTIPCWMKLDKPRGPRFLFPKRLRPMVLRCSHRLKSSSTLSWSACSEASTENYLTAHYSDFQAHIVTKMKDLHICLHIPKQHDEKAQMPPETRQ